MQYNKNNIFVKKTRCSTYKLPSEQDYVLPSWIQQLLYGGLIEPTEEWRVNNEKEKKLLKKYYRKLYITLTNIFRNMWEKI